MYVCPDLHASSDEKTKKTEKLLETEQLMNTEIERMNVIRNTLGISFYIQIYIWMRVLIVLLCMHMYLKQRKQVMHSIACRGVICGLEDTRPFIFNVPNIPQKSKYSTRKFETKVDIYTHGYIQCACVQAYTNAYIHIYTYVSKYLSIYLFRAENDGMVMWYSFLWLCAVSVYIVLKRLGFIRFALWII